MSSSSLLLAPMLLLSLVLGSVHPASSASSSSSPFVTTVATPEEDGRSGGRLRFTPVAHWMFLGPFPVGKTEVDGTAGSQTLDIPPAYLYIRARKITT